MATCKECVHKDVCPVPHLKDATICPHFKDCTKYVEVVRCKDCKHFVHGEPYDPCECMKWKTKWGVVYTTPDGYCHKGERKDK